MSSLSGSWWWSCHGSGHKHQPLYIKDCDHLLFQSTSPRMFLVSHSGYVDCWLWWQHVWKLLRGLFLSASVLCDAAQYIAVHGVDAAAACLGRTISADLCRTFSWLLRSGTTKKWKKPSYMNHRLWRIVIVVHSSTIGTTIHVRCTWSEFTKASDQIGQIGRLDVTKELLGDVNGWDYPPAAWIRPGRNGFNDWKCWKWLRSTA